MLVSVPRSFAVSARAPVVKKAVSAILHGSPEARAEGDKALQQFSAIVGRNKYVHEFQRHRCLPQHVEEYKERIGEYYHRIAQSDEFDCRLTASMEVVVGEVDSFVHIWEYEGMPGYESVKKQVKESQGHLHTFNKEILPLLSSRSSQLTQEFNFWQSSPPVKNGGIYELRTYALVPGKLLEWEQEWKVGLEARMESGHAPIGAWFSQLGRLHEVHHMWHYPSLEARREKRQQAWQIDSWSATVTKTSKLTTHMEASILKALPFSPIQ